MLLFSVFCAHNVSQWGFASSSALSPWITLDYHCALMSLQFFFSARSVFPQASLVIELRISLQYTRPRCVKKKRQSQNTPIAQEVLESFQVAIRSIFSRCYMNLLLFCHVFSSLVQSCVLISRSVMCSRLSSCHVFSSLVRSCVPVSHPAMCSHLSFGHVFLSLVSAMSCVLISRYFFFCPFCLIFGC